MHFIPILFGLLVIAGVVMGHDHFSTKLSSAERTIEYLTRHTDSKSGGTVLLTGDWINYNLKTFDSGKTWYAIEYDAGWGMTILGKAEDVYPGLLDHIEAIDRLSEYANNNGPLSFGTRSEIKLLEDAGFTVTENE